MKNFKKTALIITSFILCICVSFYAFIEISLGNINSRVKPLTREVLIQYYWTKVSGAYFEDILRSQKNQINALPLEARLEHYTKVLTHCSLYTANALTFQSLIEADAKELYGYMVKYKDKDEFNNLSKVKKRNFFYWYKILPVIIGKN